MMSELTTFVHPSLDNFHSIAVANKELKIVAGDSSGVVFFLQLMGLEFKAPIVQPVYLYHFEKKPSIKKPLSGVIGAERDLLSRLKWAREKLHVGIVEKCFK